MKKKEKEFKLLPRHEKIIKEVVEERFKRACRKHKVKSLGFTNLDPQNWKDLAMITAIIENTDN